MGFFDRKVMGGFDELYDLNHDGVLDMGEQAYQFMVFEEMMKEEERSSGSSYDDDDDLLGGDLLDSDRELFGDDEW